MAVPAVTVARFGGPEVLVVDRIAPPVAADGHVLVRVAAAAINNTDTLLRTGAQQQMLARTEPPHVPGMDLAGVVVEGDESWSAGDRVMGAISAWGANGGAQAQLVSVPSESLMATPSHLSDIEASTIPMNALTALSAIDALGVGDGDVLAVLGASGAVGGFTVQIAEARGVEVVAVTSRSRDQWPTGVDAVVDTAVVGQDATDLLRDGGRLAILRASEVTPARDIDVLRVQVTQDLRRADLVKQVERLVASGVLTARVADVFAPEQAADAHRLLERGGLRGRPVLDLSAW